jgi:hypothetical protein
MIAVDVDVGLVALLLTFIPVLHAAAALLLFPCSGSLTARECKDVSRQEIQSLGYDQASGKAHA